MAHVSSLSNRIDGEVFQGGKEQVRTRLRRESSKSFALGIFNVTSC